jgi:hypothetical protein
MPVLEHEPTQQIHLHPPEAAALLLAHHGALTKCLTYWHNR